eukprot:364807-Chlamydomonas_euryale.AAC.1
MQRVTRAAAVATVAATTATTVAARAQRAHGQPAAVVVARVARASARHHGPRRPRVWPPGGRELQHARTCATTPPSLARRLGLPERATQALLHVWRPGEVEASLREGDVVLVSSLAPTHRRFAELGPRRGGSGG